MLELRDIVVRANGPSLAQLERFSLKLGETAAIAGASGAGKTTLFRALSGARPLFGKVELDGKRLSQNDLRDLTYRTIQNFPLFHWMTPRQIINLAMAQRKISNSCAMDALTRANAIEFADRQNSTLSGGERARVSLAIALAIDAKILLLDEPFTGLDPITKLELARQFFKTSADKTRYTIFITHNLDDIESYADRCLVFREKRISESNTVRREDVLECLQ